MSKMPFTRHGFRLRPISELVSAIREAGFERVDDRRVGDGPGAFHLLVCELPAAGRGTTDDHWRSGTDIHPARCGRGSVFANPGTSEMHFVAALDDVPEMRGVLCLFEGVVTGAADGYARIAGTRRRPCCTLARAWEMGWPILHNARRAHVPLVNVVGDHATYHKQYDAPLESDIEALAQWTHGWVRRIGSGRA